MTKVAKQYRQGDVLITPIEDIPANAKLVPCKGKVVLAEGEATGHSHTIGYKPNQMEVYTDGPQLYLKVLKPVMEKHQEHAQITIEPGKYMVKRQLEFWLDEVRQVAD